MQYYVKVIPGAKTAEVIVVNDQITIRTPKHAHDGEANHAIVSLLAKHFHTAKGNIVIKKGERSRQKLIEIN